MNEMCPFDFNINDLYYYSYQAYDVFNAYYAGVEKECSKMCPLECKIEQYDLFLLSNELRDDSKLDEYKYLIEVDLSFDSVSYLNHEESPSITIYGLISNIGGAIGLLLGMSLLSIFEVLEMIIISIFLSVKYKLKSFKTKKIKQSIV
jgi:hypothetical protein